MCKWNIFIFQGLLYTVIKKMKYDESYNFDHEVSIVQCESTDIGINRGKEIWRLFSLNLKLNLDLWNLKSNISAVKKTVVFFKTSKLILVFNRGNYNWANLCLKTMKSLKSGGYDW